MHGPSGCGLPNGLDLLALFANGGRIKLGLPHHKQDKQLPVLALITIIMLRKTLVKGRIE